MKFCILGGGGYLGQVLAKDLKENSHEVVLLDIQFPSFPVIGLDLSTVKRIKGSILDRKKLKEALRGCDACFHIAAYGMSGGASLNKEMTYLVNVEGTNLVIAECISAGCRRLIFTSTVAVVFGNQEVYDLQEDTPYLEKTCALRLRGIYGPGEIRSTQTAVDMCSRGFIKATFEKSVPCLSQYSSAENVSQAMMLAEKSLRLGHCSPTNGGIYFIVDGGLPVNNFGFWFPLFEAIGQKPPSIKIPYWFMYYLAFLFEISYYVLKIEPFVTRLEVNLVALNNTYSIKKAVKDFGYNPVNNHCLKKTIDYYSSQRGSPSKEQQNRMFPGEAFWSKLFMFIAIAVISSFIWPLLGNFQKVNITAN
ncbi:hypothetical protein FO519_001553 [Halicephalobus sp. NKZ332]|nr:hypothetical protein FO519_001553 [Halicephalobus sp. NKZ332]